MEDSGDHRITFQLGWSTVIACFSTLQFGFHLAELNAPESVITCASHKADPLPSYSDTFWYKHGFDSCISMPNGIAITTTMFTIGGLISSIIIGSNKVSTNFGRKFICITNSLFYLIGSLLMTSSNSSLQINIGRFLNGIGAGLSLVISPILINELTPINHRGFLGSSLQLAVVLGILLAQVVSYNWSNEQQWRHIFLFASGLAAFQFLMLFTTVESPKWLILNQGDVRSATSILHGLRTDKSKVKNEINHWRRLSNTVETTDYEPVESTSLIMHTDSMPLSSPTSENGSLESGHVTTGQFLTSKEYRRELWAVTTVMTAQQLCGMNAITFYGVSILSNVVPKNTNVLTLTCSLSFCNVVSALAAAPLIDRFTRKSLLITSIGGMGLSSLAIAFGLVNGHDILATVSCFAFIISFSIGLGPVPFIITPEFTAHDSVGPALSVGSAMNWSTNILLAYLFPIAQNYIGGNVFYIFFLISIAYIICVQQLVPETLGYDSHEMIWNKFV